MAAKMEKSGADPVRYPTAQLLKSQALAGYQRDFAKVLLTKCHGRGHNICIQYDYIPSFSNLKRISTHFSYYTAYTIVVIIIPVIHISPCTCNHAVFYLSAFNNHT